MVERRGVAGCYRAVLLEGRLEARQFFEARIRPRPLVLFEPRAVSQRDRHHLVAKVAGLLCRERLAMAAQRPLILGLAADAVAAGHDPGGVAPAGGGGDLPPPWGVSLPAQPRVAAAVA